VISGRDELSHQQPLNERISALRNLNDGAVLPLLEPVRRSSRPEIKTPRITPKPLRYS
jgi:hypothetical protein